MTRGKMFLGLEMPWVKHFWRPYLYKIWGFMEHYMAQMQFLLCFSDVFSRARNVLPSTFSLCTRQKIERSWDCGGRIDEDKA